jgi:CMP-N,N'-diacetyllegionaminic acid synthase
VITALIPARGGSKRVPLKNARTVGGKALIDWAIELALKSPAIGKTIVSTDSSEIVANSSYLSTQLENFQNSKDGSLVEITSEFVIHKRSPESAKDHSKTFSILEDLFQISDVISDELLLLQPTSPFRSLEEVAKIIALKEKTNSNSVFSVKRVESPHPNKCFQIDEKSHISPSKRILENLQTPEQEMAAFYAPDGAFYLVSREFLKKEKAFVNLDSICFVRSGPSTLNIDTELDLKFAQYLSETNALFL